MGGVGLPLTVIVAYGIDALMKRTEPGRLSRLTILATACSFFVLFVGVTYGFSQAAPIRWSMVLVMLTLVGLLAAQYDKTRPMLLIMALVIVLITISYPKMLRQDPADIATTSQLVETMRENLPDKSRFAVAAPGLSVLSPNLNASIGLASIHGYNSLSPRRYHTLIHDLGGEMTTYGRWNSVISPDYAGTMFWMSNISLMLSPKKLSHENLQYLGEESGVHLYRVISRMGHSLQVTLPQESIRADTLQIPDPRRLETHSPTKLLDEGDVLEFSVANRTSSLLILSQKFHRDWQAQAKTPQGEWVPVQTKEVNGVFQGVLVPPDASVIRLEFKAFARYTWIVHIFWLLLLAVLGVQGLVKTKWMLNRNIR